MTTTGRVAFFCAATLLAGTPHAVTAQRGPAPSGAVAAYQLGGAPAIVLLLNDSTAGRMRFHRNGAASDIILRRATARPSVCDHSTPDTPLSDFDVFARTWAEQYGFFDIRHVDWPAVVADPYGLAIAQRLTAKDYIAYVKEACLDPSDPSRWTPGQASWVRVTNRPGFRGPVVHLTGTHSVSAAETFTQALMNREPAVVRVGQPTQGVFSDVLGRRLPNGWRFGLPNERFATNGKAYDGPGIRPHVTVPVFPPSDLASGRDSAIEKALEILGASKR